MNAHDRKHYLCASPSTGTWRVDYDPQESPHIWVTSEANSGIAKIECCDYDDGQGSRLLPEDHANAQIIADAGNVWATRGLLPFEVLRALDDANSRVKELTDKLNTLIAFDVAFDAAQQACADFLAEHGRRAFRFGEADLAEIAKLQESARLAVSQRSDVIAVLAGGRA